MPHCVPGADQESELLARIEDESDREQGDLDVDELAGLQLVNPVEGVLGHCVGGQRFVQVSHGHPQPAR